MNSQNAKKFNILPNEIYGSYITIEEFIVENNKSIERRWKVRHLITNKETVMRPSYLNIVRNRYNQRLERGEIQKGLKNYLYRNCKVGAERRNHDFKLSLDEYQKLISGDCFYCGEKPQIASNKILISRGNIHEPPLYYNGIDRIDSQLGYEINNCVSCCSTCNYMKHTYTTETFLSKVAKIYKKLIEPKN
jgi:hypothetical protein